jgi:Uma2 family endonuclease
MNRLITTAELLPGTSVDPRYPDSDGRSMGDTEFHNVSIGDICDRLGLRYADNQRIYLASNIVWYYQHGYPKKRRDPDVLVAKGVRGKHRRRSFRAWEEKVTPCVLFEIASKKTWRIDLGPKRELYAQQNVKEYFVFDPEGCYLDPVLQGFKAVKGQSVPIKAAADGSLVSKQLGLRLLAEGSQLTFFDLQTGERLPSSRERAEQEMQRANDADQRAEQEKQRAEQEKQHAQEADQRAEQEKQRAEALAAEVERLRALLGRSPPSAD